MEDFKEDRTAKFNAGIAKLIRIGKLKEGCHDARLFNKHSHWFACLKGIRSEVNSKLTSKDSKDKKSERYIADQYEAAIRLFLDNKKEEKIKINDEEVRVGDMDIYDVLYDYELWLGDIEEKYKFGMPDADDDEGL